ncbi:sigma-70 family RNA polymerase sigma factor [Streptomyces sp. NPDC052114]|uniref:RNA polymerase sigma factor n=1 Tax=unclassified Streptomyces TaxID=2593676 RepID=UPI00343CC5F0
MQVKGIEGVQGAISGVGGGVGGGGGGRGEAGDAELCARVRAGDARAFRALWERHVPMARQFALRWTHGSAADAEDAVSEAMLGLLQALRGGRGPVGNVAGYLRVSVRRAAARIASRCGREVLVAEPPDRPGENVCRAGAYFDALCAREAFLGLSEQRRTALRLFAIEERGAGHIGERLGIAPAAASSLVYRSKEALRAGYLRRHVRPANAECAEVMDRVVASLRGRPVRRQTAAVAFHLRHCASCREGRRQLRDVNAGLPQRGGRG